MSKQDLDDVDCIACKKNDAARETWGPGPWESEPNRVVWEHAGFPCIAHRGMGAWCGYVGVPPGHLFHGKGYDDVNGIIEIHGGLTYADKCKNHICHTPKPGEPDDLWWFGFDCAHAGDKIPGFPLFSDAPMFRDDDHYWTLEDVQEETNNLAEQLRALTKVEKVETDAT